MSTAPQVESPNYQPPTWDAIREAHARIAPRIHRTPVLTSHSLDAIAGAQFFFKCDNFQKTGSFKIRGAANAILSLTDDEAAHGIVTPSSGNHGAAVACAAAWRGVPAYIVMPKNAPPIKCRAVESYGGNITFSEPTMTSRHETCARVQAETGAMLIHPYDNDRIITGQATAAKELLEEVPDLDAVFAPVSGGGLLSGTCLSAKAIRPDIGVFGCEPARADDAYRSLISGTLQSLDSSDTIADGLRASLAPRTFAILRRHLDRVLLGQRRGDYCLDADGLGTHEDHYRTQQRRSHRSAPPRGCRRRTQAAGPTRWRPGETRRYFLRGQCRLFRSALLRQAGILLLFLSRTRCATQIFRSCSAIRKNGLRYLPSL